MSDPDEAMVEAVARAINAADNEWADAPRTTPHEVWPTHVARAVLSVPVVRDALARARMAEVYRTALGLASSDGWSDGESAMASYIETAETHLAVLSPADDSDIMPGSEFDGPVVL